MKDIPLDFIELPLGFVTETGEFIQSDYGRHTDQAYTLLERLGRDIYEIEDPEGFLISNYGWILIHFPCGNFVDVEYNTINEIQEVFLEGYEHHYDVICNRNYYKY